MPERVESRSASARRESLRPADETEGGQGLFSAVIEDGNIVRLEVHHGFALLVTYDQVEEDFVDARFDGGNGGLLARRAGGRQCGGHQECGR